MLIFLFFNSAYVPYGLEINSYASSIVPVSSFLSLNITNENLVINGDNLTKIVIDEKSYWALDKQLDASEEVLANYEYVKLFQDQGAISQKLKGDIIKINNNPVTNIEELSYELSRYGVGTGVLVTTDYNDQILDYNIQLKESYEEPGKPILGVSIGPKNNLRFFSMFEFYKDYGVVYKAKYNQELMDFIYYLLGWILIINVLVAFVNMLPIGLFDGGRFWYLTVLAITKKEKIAKKSFKLVTGFLLFIIVLMMVVWFMRRFLGM